MSIFRRIGRGAESLLGGFGRAILERIQGAGQSVSDAISRLQQAGVQPEPVTVAHEWGQVRLHGEREPTFGILDLQAAVPRALYTDRVVKYGGKFAYTVAAYGRDLSTGRFASPRYDIWSSRELTPQEVIDEARRNIGKEGGSPTMDIRSIKLVGASIRAGDYWD